MTHAVSSPLFRDKEGETESWGWWKGCGGGRLTREERMTATIIKNVLLLCYLEASRHSSFFCLITHLSLRYTARHQGCWQDCDTDRRRKRRKESMCSEQFNLTQSIKLNSIHLFIFYVCLFFFGVGGNSIQFLSLVHFFFLCLSEHSNLTTALPISSTRHSLTTSTRHSADPTGTRTNSVCLSSLDGHGIGKRDG